LRGHRAHARHARCDRRRCRRGAVNDAVPDVIINCAAFNLVDDAERRTSEAFAVNAFAVRSLARAAETHNAVLVHYGSDFVFAGLDGPDTAPTTRRLRHRRAASMRRRSWSASGSRSSIRALRAARRESVRNAAEWGGRRGSLDTIVSGLEAGREVTVFTDRVVSPSYVVDVAAATRHLIVSNAAPGLYHCVNSVSCVVA
jgi:dTDP-4-dehydrorhamnose reductase